jgi:uncharacterized protein (TIGR00730 family)
MTQKQFSVCLFCGSRPGGNPAFTHAAETLGRELARRGYRLVYGAGDRGLMGEAARAMQAAGGAVTGVIPQHLVDLEVGKTDLDDYIVTNDMHERKMLMFERSDAVVTLPGGPGTLDELIEVLTWRQLGLHAKPIIVVNADGYWDPLKALLDHVIGEGFADETLLGYLTFVPDAGAAVDALDAQR